MDSPGNWEDTEEAVRHGLDKKTDDGSDPKKTQVQRLFEFELWRNDKMLRDLEYSQRRAEKKKMRKERRKALQNRCWKKLYLPAVLGMVGGTFLTLCGTLQSLAGDTFLWNMRGSLVVVGPVMVGIGFLALMLAAGCTFKYDHEVRQKPIDPPSEFLLYNSEFENEMSRPSVTLRSMSVDTTDLPIPDDLDPSSNFLSGKSAWSRDKERAGSVSKDGSVDRSALPVPDSSYNSTASWVNFVSASHSQQRATLTRQNSDSNLLSSATRCDRHLIARRSLRDSSEVQDQLGSQSELNIVCTRSLTSSGYQSNSDSTTGTVECQVSSETGRRVIHSYTPLRHGSRRPASSAITKLPETEPKAIGVEQGIARGIHRSPFDHGVRQVYPEPAAQRAGLSSRQTNAPGIASVSSSTFSKRQDFLHRMHQHNRHLHNGLHSWTGHGKDGDVQAPPSKTSIHFTAASLHGITNLGGAEQIRGTHTCCKDRPLYLEPQVYAAGTVRCTEL